MHCMKGVDSSGCRTKSFVRFVTKLILRPLRVTGDKGYLPNIYLVISSCFFDNTPHPHDWTRKSYFSDIGSGRTPSVPVYHRGPASRVVTRIRGHPNSVEFGRK